jgi:hypothetical protein
VLGVSEISFMLLLWAGSTKRSRHRRKEGRKEGRKDGRKEINKCKCLP